LHTPAQPLALETLCDVELLGYLIPAGTQLALLNRYIGLVSDSFARPRSFEPERWLTSTVEARGFLPFGAGPRVCPGRGLAYLEAKTALAMLVHAFDLTPDPTAPPVVERFSFITGPSSVPVLLRALRGTS
jgi:cytochrome P450